VGPGPDVPGSTTGTNALSAVTTDDTSSASWPTLPSVTTHVPAATAQSACSSVPAVGSTGVGPCVGVDEPFVPVPGITLDTGNVVVPSSPPSTGPVAISVKVKPVTVMASAAALSTQIAVARTPPRSPAKRVVNVVLTTGTSAAPASAPHSPACPSRVVNTAPTTEPSTASASAGPVRVATGTAVAGRASDRDSGRVGIGAVGPSTGDVVRGCSGVSKGRSGSTSSTSTSPEDHPVADPQPGGPYHSSTGDPRTVRRTLVLDHQAAGGRTDPRVPPTHVRRVEDEVARCVAADHQAAPSDHRRAAGQSGRRPDDEHADGVGEGSRQVTSREVSGHGVLPW
jgi:hypothetical protein